MSEHFDQLKELLDNVHDYGHYLSALCPFHEDSKPSFLVYEDKYCCLSCGCWGRTEDLARRLDKTIRRYINESDSESFSNPFSTWFRQASLSDILREAWQFINRHPKFSSYITSDRKIVEPFRRQLGIGYKDDWFTIPIRNRSGKIVGAVARASPSNSTKSKYIMPHGTHPWLLYVPQWKYENQNRLVVTYGILDAITLAINGVMSASTLTGKTINPMAFDGFQEKIIIVPDLGEEKEANVLASKLGWRGSVYFPKYPENCKDINDIWVNYPELLKEIANELV